LVVAIVPACPIVRLAVVAIDQHFPAALAASVEGIDPRSPVALVVIDPRC
jgi:hypothetical protein